jgi:hypothetical protein
MADTISWVATAATIIAAFMTAANLGPRITGYGFAVFTAGAICWIAVGVSSGQPALTWTNIVLVLLDAFGVWRWLGWQTKVEEGGEAAAQASEQTPGEALFPVSLLTRAAVDCSGTEVGRCVDAMAGCRSGKLAYVVVAEGGMAGIGDTLRRLPWGDARVEGERLVSRLKPGEFRQLQELAKDEWPGR